MTQVVAEILREVVRLPAHERAEFADRLVETLALEMPAEIEHAQIAEVQRRIAQVESGEVTLIQGERALAEVRRLVESARRPS